jgi:Zn-dependent oligopeptidase
MFTEFEKKGLLNKAIGKKYREWILEKGSSMDEMELVKGFLGRKPNNKAFLRSIGVGK